MILYLHPHVGWRGPFLTLEHEMGHLHANLYKKGISNWSLYGRIGVTGQTPNVVTSSYGAVSVECRV